MGLLQIRDTFACQIGFKGKQCGKKGDQKLRTSLNKYQVYLHVCVLSSPMNLVL